jgi:single-stranded-DNA-specific exonuclease
MAAGLKLRPENFEKFQRAFIDYANRTIPLDHLVPELKLDCLAELKHVTEALVNDLKRLGPFGHGNRKPILCCRQVQLAAPPRRVERPAITCNSSSARATPA